MTMPPVSERGRGHGRPTAQCTAHALQKHRELAGVRRVKGALKTSGFFISNGYNVCKLCFMLPLSDVSKSGESGLPSQPTQECFSFYCEFNPLPNSPGRNVAPFQPRQGFLSLRLSLKLNFVPLISHYSRLPTEEMGQM